MTQFGYQVTFDDSEMQTLQRALGHYLGRRSVMSVPTAIGAVSEKSKRVAVPHSSRIMVQSSAFVRG